MATITPVLTGSFKIIMTSYGKISLPLMTLNTTRQNLIDGVDTVGSIINFDIQGSLFSGCNLCPITDVTNKDINNTDLTITNKNNDIMKIYHYSDGSLIADINGTTNTSNMRIINYTTTSPNTNVHIGVLGVVQFNDSSYTLFRLNLGYVQNRTFDYTVNLPVTNSEFGYFVIDNFNTSQIPYLFSGNNQGHDLITDFINNVEFLKPNVDPYADGGTSEPGGGGGSFDDSTDVITIPEYDPTDLLNRSYGNRGFVHVYLPTQAELTALHAFMWNNSLIVEMQKMFNNVADAVISLNLLPLDFTDATPNRGNILMGLVDSQIETTIAKQQFVTLDCGTIEINEFFASYLDYSPYSKLQIYLPYIGVKDLDIDEFMNAYINVKYVIDIVSGACVAFISKTGAIDNDVVKDNPILGVLYQFAGNCALNVPISGANYAQVHAADIGALIGGAGVLGTFLTGGMSAPAAVTGILSTAANVVTSKPAISRGGSIPSTVGYMSIQKPYLILTRPRMCLPEDQNTFTGYPAYVTMTPGDTSGYTEFEIIHLENIPATDAEKNELETLMKTGVIL